jgi:uncharacterized protein YjbJ (UPF0337 family)
MEENRISGGKAEEAVGRVTGDLKKQVQGKLDQAAGAAQESNCQTADAPRFDKLANRSSRRPLRI